MNKKPLTNKTKAPGPSEAGWHKAQSAYHCPKEHQFAEVRRIEEAQKAQTEDPLGSGLCLHAGRAEWLMNNFRTDSKTFQLCQDAVLEEAEKQRFPVTRDAKERAFTMLATYIQHYSMLPKQRPVAVEKDFGPVKTLPSSTQLRTARPDDVSYYPEAGNALMLGDLKTTSDTVANLTKFYDLHGQTMLGLAVYRADPNGERRLGKASGYMLDIVQKTYDQKTPYKFARVPIYITDFQLSWFLPDLDKVLVEAGQVEWDTHVRRNPTACQRVHGRRMFSCMYMELCKHGRNASIKYQLSDGTSLANWKPSPGKTVAPWE